jgi:hypothetical protein
MKKHNEGVQRTALLVLIAVFACGISSTASALDKIKVAIGQIDAWVNQVPTRSIGCIPIHWR